MKSKQKTPMYRKWWFWASIAVMILSIVTGDNPGFGY